MRNLSVFIILVFLMGRNVQAQWTQASGPYGGVVRCLCIVPGSGGSENLLAGTDLGVYVSTNYGTSWSHIDNAMKEIYDISTDGKTVVAGSSSLGGLVWLSTDGGLNWTNTKVSGLSSGVNATAVTGQYIFAVSYGVMAFSQNGGSTWTLVKDLFNGQNIYSIIVSGTSVFAGANHGVYRSDDFGKTWKLVNLGFSNDIIHALAVRGQNIFASTNGFLYKTSNNGDYWYPVNNTLQQLQANSLAVSGDDIYAASFPNYPPYVTLSRSSNDGQDWINLTGRIPEKYIQDIAASGSRIFAATLNGIYLSTDRGENWKAVNEGINSPMVYSLAVSGGNIIAAVKNKFLYLMDNAVSWQQASASDFHIIGSNIAVSDSCCFNFTDNYLFRSTNNGKSWIKSDTLQGTSIYACRSDVYIYKYARTFLYSGDNGKSWKTNQLPNVYDFQILTVDEKRITAIAKSSNSALYLSYDHGTTWNAFVTSNAPTSVYCGAEVGDVIFAASHAGGIYRISGNYADWVILSDGFSMSDTQSMIVYRNFLIAGTKNGIYITGNLGDSWSKISSGPFNFDVTSLTIKDGYLYAGTRSSGVLKRSLSEVITSVNENNDKKLPAAFSLTQNYPNPFNPTTTIKVTVQASGNAEVVIYNMLGEKVSIIHSGTLGAGEHEFIWDAASFPSGIYLCTMKAGSYYNTIKMMLVK